jgi:hypothetical protein
MLLLDWSNLSWAELVLGLLTLTLKSLPCCTGSGLVLLLLAERADPILLWLWIVEHLSSLTEQPLPGVEQTSALAEQTKSGPAATALYANTSATSF